MQPETEDEKLAAALLGAIGLNAVRVQGGGAPNCDYVGSDGKASYAFEVKSRTDSEELWKTTRRGGIFDSEQALHRSSRIEAIVDDAMTQLKHTGTQCGADFSVVVFVIRPVFSRDAECQRVLGTLYGTQAVLDIASNPTTGGEFNCLYFRESRFFRHTDLSGAILLVEDEVTLFANSCASNATGFRESTLYQKFASCYALFDPVLHATRERGFLIADFDMPRSDLGAVLAALRTKYGLDKVILLNPVERSAAVAVPRLESSKSAHVAE